MLFLQFIDEKKLDLEEFIENCEKEISNFLNKNSPLTIKNNYDYEQYDQLGLSGEDLESPEELSLDLEEFIEIGLSGENLGSPEKLSFEE